MAASSSERDPVTWIVSASAVRTRAVATCFTATAESSWSPIPSIPPCTKRLAVGSDSDYIQSNQSVSCEERLTPDSRRQACLHRVPMASL
jgi:hypothetical protein